MSLGMLKEDFDKKEHICKVIDVILNPTVIQMSKKNKESVNFLYQLIGTYINQKHKIELSEDFKMPKISYKGKSVEFQRVKGSKAPKIQTVSSSDDQNASKEMNDILKDGGFSGTAARPEWSLSLKYSNEKVEEFDGLNENLNQMTGLIYEFKMPLLVTGKNILVEVSPDEIYIRNGRMYEITLRSLCTLNATTAKSHFNIKSRTLVLEIDKYIKPEVTKDDEAALEKVKETTKVVAPVNLDNDLLYDIV